MKIDFRLIIIFLFSILFAASCDSGDECREELNVKMKAELYRVVYDENKDEYRTEKYTIPLFIEGVGSDSILYDSVSVSSFEFYLRDFESETQIEIMDTLFVKDTITIEYGNEEMFISLECGSVVNKKIERVKTTTNMVDSVIIKEVNVNTQKVTNMYLYMKNRK